ncbi:DNA repair protein RadC [Candidatus Woesearchaeota archaeon]|nr:DNA repair protein RadC [Candidatus Woesearchaeota archaeon]
MRIKDIPLQNQPRHRFENMGASALSDAELLAVILQKGTKNENVVDMCNRLLKKHNIEQLSQLSLAELKKIHGIGPAKAMQVKAIFEFTKRTRPNGKRYINCANDVYDIYYNKFKGEKQEIFMVVMLDTRNNIIGEEIVSIGILDSAIVHPREIFKPAIKNSAAKIILLHNHPSGDARPSREDLRITERVIEAGKLLDILVLDHVIIGDNYWSWREQRA